MAKNQEKSKKPKCGLCGKTKNLVQTECCGNWICDDASNYKLFSYANNSCYRNHGRYTLCAYHYNEGHEGDWKSCTLCRMDFETEIFVWYGTNEYNFEKLTNPPSFEPTRCAKCNRIISLAGESYVNGPEGYFCQECASKEFGLPMG